MKFSRAAFSPTLILIVLLPILLGALATLQYRWLTEISEAEYKRTQRRLNGDAKHFAGDLNAEITKVFFSFHFASPVAETELAERFELWQTQSQFPNLISDVYVFQIEAPQDLQRFNLETKKLENAVWNDELTELRQRRQLPADAPPAAIGEKLLTNALDERSFALIVPVLPRPDEFIGELKNRLEKRVTIIQGRDDFPLQPFFNAKSYLILKLNEQNLQNEILPALTAKHFNQDYLVTIENIGDRRVVFQSSAAQDLTKNDVEIKLLRVAPESSNVLFVGKSAPPMLIERRRQTGDNSSDGNRGTLKNEDAPLNGSLWRLTARHVDGSLEAVVGKTKFRNLAISFGILTLLGASVVLLILSTQRAKSAAQRQIDFVSSVSHEFRTPVAVICAAGDNLADGIVSDKQQIEKYGQLIRRESKRLAAMIEQILQFAGANAKHPNYSFQPADLREIVESAVKDCAAEIAEKKFVVNTAVAPDLPPVEVDANALRQSLQNLIGNALKFSNGSHFIEIAANRADDKILISVEDHGIGIDKSELKAIFEPFYRGKKVVAAQIHGNGLGLSLVKQIVTAHHGKIRVESAPHQGSKFIIELPVK